MEASETQKKPAMEIKPRKEHRWLQKFVGEWTYEGSVTLEPGQPPERFTGTESVRSFGELWILDEGRGEMPGMGSARTIMMLGYDTRKNRFVGTYVMSVMNNLWVYEGSLDATEKILTLEAEGPGMTEEKTSKFRDVYEFKSDDHRTLTSHMLGDDGKWQEFSRSEYRRKK
ncbi:MAG: DUF1579 domain-containing protein [Candidatus Latescibacterota bacterium]